MGELCRHDMSVMNLFALHIEFFNEAEPPFKHELVLSEQHAAHAPFLKNMQRFFYENNRGPIALRIITTMNSRQI
jgi:hypothetical protein